MNLNRFLPLVLVFAFCISLLANSGCSVRYGFTENNPSLPDSIKSIWIHYIENRASYVNPQLSTTLTERLKQKITRQTKLVQTNNPSAHLDLVGEITEYAVTTSGISSANGQKQTS